MTYTYVVFFIDHRGFTCQWATVAKDENEAREKFLKRRGSAGQILCIRKKMLNY